MTDIIEYADKVWRGEASQQLYHRGDLRREGMHRVADGAYMWPAFGNVYVFPTDAGLFVYDTGDLRTANELFSATRELSDRPIHTAVYSHGHIDHIFGMGPFDEEAARRGWERPTVVAQEAVLPRFDRYRRTRGYNGVINQRQFQAPNLQWPNDYRYPDVTFGDRTTLTIDDLVVDLRHARGETDDAAIAWLPDRKILCCGDFFIWASPNAGNPQKVQRFAYEWARTLRWMAGLGAEILLPGHGLPVVGVDRIRVTLTDAAELLETLHCQTLELMNAGATLDEVIHTVTAPAELLKKPYLAPSYDEPEFVVRNVWRMYGGWYDGNPANLKAAHRNDLAREMAEIGGGAERLAERARELLARGEHRLAGHLAQMAADADPGSRVSHETRLDVFGALERAATSTMAKGVYSWAAAESRAFLEGSDRATELKAKTAGRSQWAF
ncbi:alkyl sulfatase dimerization domain-containing protein [Rhodococcus wratislaviensis]|uniref:alkyl sulfatase dimerization domain-containing protein n=1 Tax=Rhodococcus wratislaviensis TaxID=44752 RepID=UPI00351275DA